MKKKQPAGCCRHKHLKKLPTLESQWAQGVEVEDPSMKHKCVQPSEHNCPGIQKISLQFCNRMHHIQTHFFRSCMPPFFLWIKNMFHCIICLVKDMKHMARHLIIHTLPSNAKNVQKSLGESQHGCSQHSWKQWIQISSLPWAIVFFVWLATEEPSTGCNCCILMFSSRTNWRQKSPPKCQSQHQIHCVKKFFLPAASSNNFCNFLAWASGHMPRTSATYPASPFSVVTTSLEGQASWRSSRSNSKVSGSWPETAMRTASLKSQNNKTTRPRTLWRLCGFCKPNAKSIVTQYTTYK